MEQLFSVLLLGFMLGLDSLRVSVGLGTRTWRLGRQIQIALAFGLCDAVAPLVGLATGSSMTETVRPVVEIVGPLVLGAYGFYLVCISRRSSHLETSPDEHWIILALPLVLSLDNLLVGFGMGALGFPIMLSAVVIGAISAFMSLIGLTMGNVLGRFAIGRLASGKADLLSGVTLIALALMLAVGNI